MALFASIGMTSAQNVSRSEATSIAQQFLQRKGVSLVAQPSSHVTAVTAKQSADDPAFYVYNNGTNGGFVIIAADDRAEQVLGYSTSGHFDYATAPDQVRAWIGGYAEQIDWMKTQPSTSAATLRRAPQAQTKKLTPHDPLLGDIAWDQTWPYNLLTPYYVGTTHSATGCVATAMAQIMYYHRWPEQGVGQKTYKPETLNTEVSVDFSQSHYDWDATTPTYNASSSDVAQQAVALLMRDCGVAVDMAYGEQSGSSIEKWLQPLSENFSYDSHVGYLNRNYYTEEDWNAIIRQEIDARRPVFSTGFTYSSGGHAYVFDGYDEDGLIHVNWGWSGMSNGYFRMSALTPPTQGTGGSSGGFNYKQGIIVGIQPRTEGLEDWLQIVSAERTKATPTEGAATDVVRLRLGGRIANYGWKSANVDMGFAFCDAQGNTVRTLVALEAKSLEVNGYVVACQLSDIDLSSLPTGQYKVYPVVRNSGGERWFRVRDYSYAKPNWLNLSITDEGWTFANPTDYDLQASHLESTKIYQNTTARVTACVHNQGELTYSGPLRIALFNTADGTLAAQGDDFKYDIAGGDSTDVALTSTFTVAPGTYALSIIDENSQQVCNPQTVSVLQKPSETTQITMQKQLFCNTEGTLSQDSLALTAQLNVAQGVFANDLTIYIYDANEQKVMGSFNPTFLFAEAGEQPEVHFTGTFENGQPGETYKAVLLNLTESTYIYPRDMASCLFTLTSATAIDTVKWEKTTDQTIYSLDGRVVRSDGKLSLLPPGLYIMNGKKYAVSR